MKLRRLSSCYSPVRDCWATKAVLFHPAERASGRRQLWMCQASGMSKRNPNNCLYARNVTSHFKTTCFLLLHRTKQPNSLWPLSFILSPVKLWTVISYRVTLYRFPLDIRCWLHLNPNTKQTKIKISFSSTLALSFADCFLNPLITFKLAVALWGSHPPFSRHAATCRVTRLPWSWRAVECEHRHPLKFGLRARLSQLQFGGECLLWNVKLLAAIWTTRLAETTAQQKHHFLPILVWFLVEISWYTWH